MIQRIKTNIPITLNTQLFSSKNNVEEGGTDHASHNNIIVCKQQLGFFGRVLVQKLTCQVLAKTTTFLNTKSMQVKEIIYVHCIIMFSFRGIVLKKLRSRNCHRVSLSISYIQYIYMSCVIDYEAVIIVSYGEVMKQLMLYNMENQEINYSIDPWWTSYVNYY